MSLLDGFRHRIHVLLHREEYGRDIEREMRFHVELETLGRSGIETPAHDAELAARRIVGNVTYYREETRQMTLLRWVDRIEQDLSYAMRGLRRSPGFTATVILTLALGFGVNAAMYSMLDQVFRRDPAGVVAPREVRRIYKDLSRPKEPGGRLVIGSFTFPHYKAVANAAAPLELAAFTTADSVTITDGASRIPARQGEVTGNYFSVLGLKPELGRFFVAEENQVETPTPVAVISDGFWRSAFNADPKILGRRVLIDHRAVTIVGVAAKDFTGIDLDAQDLWLPANMSESSNGPGPWYQSFGSSYRIIARMRSPNDAARMVARGEPAMHAVRIQYFSDDSTSHLFTGSIVEANGPMRPAQEVNVATRISWIAIIVLVIACANVTNLLLLRATSRKREIAVRRALGVSHARLYQQLTVESTLLAVLGGAAAVIVAFWTGGALRRLMMPKVHWASGPLDMHTVAFLAILSLVIGVGAGLAPALHAVRPDLADSLKAGSREGAYQHSALRSALLVAQAALCIVLLIGAGLFLRSLDNMKSISVGYSVDTVTLVTPVFTAPGQHARELTQALPLAAERVSHIDGVEAAAFASSAPMRGYGFAQIALPDRDSLPRLATDAGPSFNAISPDYFRATGVGIRMGRAFSPADAAASAGVLIVSETMARVYWPGTTAIGKCVILGKRTNPCSTVVGVAADVHRSDIIEQPVMHYYVPLAQGDRDPRTLVIKTRPGRAVSAAHEAERILKQTVSGMDGTRTLRLADALEPQLRPWRLGATLFTAFGILALVVAAIGVYSVVAYGVSQRTNEMGIRVALGARTSDILDLVLGEGIRLLVIGIALGVVAALAMGRFVASMLFGVVAYDPSVLIGASLVLCVLGTIACVVPGWRAARVDPLTALRAD